MSLIINLVTKQRHFLQVASLAQTATPSRRAMNTTKLGDSGKDGCVCVKYKAYKRSPQIDEVLLPMLLYDVTIYCLDACFHNRAIFQV